jgi:hypothetical protein
MWILFLIFVATVGVGATLTWPRREDAPRGNGGQAGPQRPAAPESLEGALVAQLTSGEITRPQYTRAMEKLAARDAERHPLSVPPEVGGAA